MKRRVAQLALLLLLGAIINIAVAWVLAYSVATGLPNRIAPWRPVQGIDGMAGWYVYRMSAFGSRRFTAMMQDSNDVNSPLDDAIPSIYPSWTDWPDSLDHQVELARQRPPAKAGGRIRGAAPMPMMVEARGWPMLALRCEWLGGFNTDNTVATRRWTSAIALPPRVPDRPSMISLDQQRALPLRPIWPGFAINTIFYAAILWLVFILPLTLRRRRRLKRGLCSACGYDLRGRGSVSSTCPECGKPTHQNRARQQAAAVRS